jgi:hypothetical protein
MKKLLVLLFSILISFNSYGEWVKVTESIDSNVFYVETNTIREKNGYVYFWNMTDFFERSNNSEMMSSKLYVKLDCDIYRYQDLAFTSYSQSMGNGKSIGEFTPPDDWIYPKSGTADYLILDFVCDYVK